MNIRNVQEEDYIPIITVLNDWWGGRNMADMLPKLFFQHFQNTSFMCEKDGNIAGFVIGFVSQTRKAEAYIHFVGVHPDYRSKGIAKALYETFFEAVQNIGCQTVGCVTSPVNKGSIAYHTKMGFEIRTGTKAINGISVHENYDGRGQDRVLFFKKLL
ncbi:GNAT family N-acetyltransferase [Ectobacillus panaciterrae]|uniref:GNAT family N-acetyltransferase n=1 Tax=Ectobacillus panaciterrae TaxID=363872 RepID=UPI00040D22A7|nr:GNAT family N-acetyltransferase [Ectobacillus panaciterrae]